jgi:hypothetical protein
MMVMKVMMVITPFRARDWLDRLLRVVIGQYLEMWVIGGPGSG